MDSWPPRPTLSSTFYKGHGLGNDYLVFEEGDDWVATDDNVRRVCDRHFGVGSDGMVALLEGLGAGSEVDSAYRVALRMFNPDGSEFERSGNGLRVLASYVAIRSPEVRTVEASVGGDTVRMTLHGRAGPLHDVSVEMGRAATGAEAVRLDPGALHSGSIEGPDGEALVVVPVSVGNPHLVVLVDEADFAPERLSRLGPYLSTHEGLARGANVQLARAEEGGACRALIWERGVGPTSASGTSACAVAAAMVTLGIAAAGPITVRMPGGELLVEVGSELDLVLRGPVEEVMEGKLRPPLVADLLGAATSGPES